LTSINARGAGRCHDVAVTVSDRGLGGIDMPHYQVSLYKDLLSSDGHPFHCLQATIEVDAEAPEGAVQIALKDVRGCLRDWSIEVSEQPSPLPAAAGSAAQAL
jgi:hypothetical protein